MLLSVIRRSGETLCRQGDAATACYFVQRGELTLYTREQVDVDGDEGDAEADRGRGGTRQGRRLWHNRRHQV